MDVVFKDLWLACRSLARRPGFALAAILTLALGIGANASVFSVVSAVLLRPLPYAEPARVVMVWNHWTGWPRTWLSEPEVQDYRTQSGVFARFAPFDDGAANLTGNGTPERVRVGMLSTDVLPALGVAPALGRNFSADEDRPGGARAVLLGQAVWRHRFAGAPDVVGRTLTVNGVPRTIVGVLPEGFRMPLDFAESRADIYLPLALGPADPGSRGSHYLNAVARLAPGVALAQAQSAMDAFVARMRTGYPNAYDGNFGATLVPVGDQVFGAVKPALILVSAAVAFVLLLACVNVASLMLMRAEGRQQELAIRRAIGAGLFDLARLSLAESLVLSLGGAVAGLVLAAWAVALLPHLSPESLPRVGDVRVDGRVIAFTALASVVTTLLCGLMPVWRAARSDPHPGLSEGARGATGRGAARFRRTVIAVELAAAVLLCVGAGLLLRSFVRLTSVEPGFEKAGVLTFRLSVPQASYQTDAAAQALVAGVLERLRALPGVTAVGGTSGLPLGSVPGDWSFGIEGHLPVPPEPTPAADWMVATPGYAEAMGIRLVAGRWLTASDARGTPGVVVINQATARAYWPDRSPIGERIRLGGRADTLPRAVVGVVADVHQNSLDAAPRNQMYLPHAQFPATLPDSVSGAARGMSVAIRTTRRPTDLIPEVRAVLREANPDIPLAVVRTLDDVVRASTATPRFALAMVGAFALLALAIAGVGVYGVVAYVVALRTREIGVRVALGAQRRDVLRLVLGQGMGPAAAGIAVGLAGAFAARGFVGTLLYEVPATDGATFLGAAALLAAVGLVACYLPARRAAKVDPMVALRSE